MENKTPNVAEDGKEEDVFAEMKKIVRDRKKQAMVSAEVYFGIPLVPSIIVHHYHPIPETSKFSFSVLWRGGVKNH